MGSAHRFQRLCGGCPRQILPALAAAIVLSMTVFPVVAADVLLPLPNVAIPPAQGKTGSFDIMEVDQAAHLLYVADRTTGGVDVFNIATPAAQYVQTIDTGAAPNGLVVAKNVNKLFVGAADSSVVVIDIAPGSMTRNTIIARLNTGGKKRTDEMDYDPVEKKLYAANSDDGIVTVIDAVRNTIVKKFENMGDGLEQPRYDPADGMMYMTSSDQNAVFQFDPRSDTLVRKVTVSVDCNPNGMAINTSTNQAILGCSNKKTPMTVLWDVPGARVITTFPDVGAGDAVIYNAKANAFFFAASNFPKGAALAVFSGSPVHWVANAPTAVGSHAVAYDETNRVVYTIDQRPNQAGLMAFWLVSETVK